MSLTTISSTFYAIIVRQYGINEADILQILVWFSLKPNAKTDGANSTAEDTESFNSDEEDGDSEISSSVLS